MPRTAQIHYRRVNFSLPAALVQKFNQKVEKNSRSKYVANLIEDDLVNRPEDINDLIESTAELAKKFESVDSRDSLTILKEMRHGR